MELWKPINGYEGFYEVSSLGRVRSLNRIDSIGRLRKGKILKQFLCGHGYLFVGLHKDGKTIQRNVHKLVAEAFIGDCPDGYTVNHKDENKRNNHIENLEYLTPIDNLRHGTAIERMAVGHRKPIAATVIETGAIEYYSSITAAGNALGGDRSNIGHALHGRLDTAFGRTWKFAKEAGQNG